MSLFDCLAFLDLFCNWLLIFSLKKKEHSLADILENRGSTFETSSSRRGVFLKVFLIKFKLLSAGACLGLQ